MALIGGNETPNRVHHVNGWRLEVPEHIPNLFADNFDVYERTIQNCRRVLIESCNLELHLARSFCDLADDQLAKLRGERALQLVKSAQKAIAVAGRHCKDPEERRVQRSVVLDRISQLLSDIRKRTGS